MHMNNRVRKSDWSDSISGDPIGDIRAAVAESDVFGHVVLYLTRDSIRDLMVHPDMSRMWRHDWKYLFQVDEVKMSASDVDYIQSGEQEPQKWQPIETAPRDENVLLGYTQQGDEMPTGLFVGIGVYMSSGKIWVLNSYDNEKALPSHWMPLPEPPNDD